MGSVSPPPEGVFEVFERGPSCVVVVANDAEKIDELTLLPKSGTKHTTAQFWASGNVLKEYTTLLDKEELSNRELRLEGWSIFALSLYFHILHYADLSDTSDAILYMD